MICEILGKKVIDTCTGFKGTCISVTETITDEPRALIMYLVNDEFKGRWVDIKRLEMIDQWQL